MIYEYTIAEWNIAIEAPPKIGVETLLPSFAPFATQGDGQCLFTLHLSDEGSIAKPMKELTHFEWEGGTCTVSTTPSEGLHLHLLPPDRRQSGQMEIRPSGHHHPTDAIACLPTDSRQAAFVLNNFLMMLFAFTTATRHTLMVHASVVLHRGRAYLFLGRSGTGKSTHTNLWLQHIPDSELLNDDNPLLRFDPLTRQVTVYGSPWSGKTPCYRNVQAPVGAIVRLKQAPQNSIERLTGVKAFATLLPSCSCLKQDEGIYNGIVATAYDVIAQIPVFQLQCLPNKEAAELCHRETAAV